MPAFYQTESWYQLPILGPYAIALAALTTVAQTAVAADVTRAGIIFHNPGTVNKRVMPSDSALAGGSGGILIYPQEEFVLLRQPDMPYNVNCAWNAVTDNIADGSLTVLNFTPLTPGAPEVSPTTRMAMQIQVTSPTSTQVLLGTASQPVLPADANRMGVEFHNPGTVTLALCPSNLAAIVGAGSIVLLPGQTKRIIGNSRVKINCAWNGIAAQGNNNAVTALGLYG